MKALCIGKLVIFPLLFSPMAQAGFDYICIQPQDKVYTTLPAIEWHTGLDSIKDEYHDPELFKPKAGNPDILTFSPVPSVEIVLYLDDYENEVIFDGVRILKVDGKLYTWISMTGTANEGVVHRIVRAILINGKEVTRSKPLTVDVRKDLSNCN